MSQREARDLLNQYNAFHEKILVPLQKYIHSNDEEWDHALGTRTPSAQGRLYSAYAKWSFCGDGNTRDLPWTDDPFIIESLACLAIVRKQRDLKLRVKFVLESLTGCVAYRVALMLFDPVAPIISINNQCAAVRSQNKKQTDKALAFLPIVRLFEQYSPIWT